MSSATAALVLAGGQAALLAGGLQASAHDLPLGDDKISDAPRAGYVFSCQQRFNKNTPGAHASGDWLGTATWDPDRKPHVQGSVTWPAEISIQREGERRVIRANNLPTHPTGTFPIQRSDPAYQYDRNNGRITAQDILLEMPAVPEIAASPSCVPMGMIGFTLTNAAQYNALDGRGDDAPAHEMQDKCGGHPQQTGQYHYHNMTPCIDDTRSQPGGHSDLIGYAIDGFGLFGKYGEGGRKLTNQDLDACHGHSHAINWDGEARTLYHYHMTDEYPYSIGCFMGTPANLPGSMGGAPQGPDDGPRQGRGGPENRPGGPGGPQQVLANAAAQLGVSADALRRAVGPPPPDFQRASRMLGIPADEIRRALDAARSGR
ncbi:YHYH protein [Hoeflea poritis]|uniref:YHYH protein n=1 Tax=Hoeflea poritis TaxID=2993659 RepID=A0ABT4VLM7_9HYPH|nr:YHYH protein [Hoeflea poritis]MDA4845579.1 YHYH protein [Hoeflea poritis]